MADKEKLQEERKTGGPKMLRPGLGSLARKKKKNKKLLSAEEFFKIKDSDQKFTGPKSTKGSLGDTINQFREMDNKIISSLKMAKGGRAMLRGGGICKKGMNKKAVGKNS